MIVQNIYTLKMLVESSSSGLSFLSSGSIHMQVLPPIAPIGGEDSRSQCMVEATGLGKMGPSALSMHYLREALPYVHNLKLHLQS